MAFDYTRAPEAGRALAGSALIAAGAFTLMGIITAEAVYPEAYATRANDISDLAAPRGRSQPSATIFNLAMIASGALFSSRRTASSEGSRSIE